MDASSCRDDPGWRPALRDVSWLLPPGARFIWRLRAARRGIDCLTVLRRDLLGFAASLVTIGAVVVVLSVTTSLTKQRALPAIPFAAALTVIGSLALAVQRVYDRPLDCADDRSLATAYRARF
jgi:hypothetical protein